MSLRKVLLAAPRGWCAGVDRAVEIVERALEIHGPPVYVRKQIVHNRHVVEGLERRGAVFVDEVDLIPPGSHAVLSAHGSSPAVYEMARQRGLDLIDATCPLVSKVHIEARRFADRDRTIVLIGHKGHEEVEGTMGEAPDRTVLVQDVAEAEALSVADPDSLSYLTQTTLSVDETKDIIDTLQRRFPAITAPTKDDICYATTNRQAAVKVLAARAPLVLVIGAPNSSNSLRMVEVARQQGAKSHLIEDETQLDPAWLEGLDVVGLSSSASAPEWLVERVLDHLKSFGPAEVEEVRVVDEDVRFPLPREVLLRRKTPAAR
ncbi:MAG TPA: 4-hydroxy-3-methylbut-2-enyl diphosphate reductase [Actinomycetota bacterium]|nr:4-hydroxy-3-methylbut-2-enyl diphosphate reductase [Actinomycetota bacterium]